METTKGLGFRVYIGIMEKKMDITIIWYIMGLRVLQNPSKKTDRDGERQREMESERARERERVCLCMFVGVLRGVIREIIFTVPNYKGALPSA